MPRKILAALGLAWAAIVLWTFRDYGINPDEALHVIYGESIVDWYLSGFRDRTIFSYTNIWLYGGLYDTVTWLFTQISPLAPYDSRHLLNAFVGFAGVIGTYALTRHVTDSQRAGLIAALMLLLVPRYYGHAFFNHKDIPFAVGYIWSLYAILKSADEFPNVPPRIAIFTGIVVGATLGIRIAGLVLVPYYVLAVLFSRRLISFEQDARPALRTILITTAVAWPLMVVCWPWTHANPVLRPFLAFTMISDFPFSITNLFEGQIYDSSNIPWYYALKWLLIGLPEYLLIGVALAIPIASRAAVRDRLYSLGPSTLVGIAALIPLLYVVATGAPLYNGMRHLIFIVPPMCVLSAVAVDRWLDRNDLPARVLVGCVALSVLVTLVDLVRLHPNQYVYFNRVFGGGLASAAGQFDTDYFFNSHREGVRWISEGAEQRTVNSPISELSQIEKIQHRVIPWRAEYIIQQAYVDGRIEAGGEIAHTIEAAGVPIANVVHTDPGWQGDPVYRGPNAEFHYAWLASAHARVGNTPTAQDLLERALMRRPDRAVWHFTLGRILKDDGNFDAAIPVLERTISLQPTYRAWFHLGSCYHQTGRYEDAVRSYRSALDIRFDSEWAYLNLGGSLAALGRLDDAEAAYHSALDIDPHLTDAWDRLAQLYVRRNNHSKALEAIESALRDTSTSELHTRRAASLRVEGRLEEASESALEAIEMAPDTRAAWDEVLRIASTFHERGNTDRAEPLYRRYLDKWPDSESAWLNLAILLYTSDRFEDSRGAFTSAFDLNPGSFEALLGVAQSAEQLGDSAGAQQAYKDALRIDPSNEVARERLEPLER